MGRHEHVALSPHKIQALQEGNSAACETPATRNKSGGISPEHIHPLLSANFIPHVLIAWQGQDEDDEEIYQEKVQQEPERWQGDSAYAHMMALLHLLTSWLPRLMMTFFVASLIVRFYPD